MILDIVFKGNPGEGIHLNKEKDLLYSYTLEWIQLLYYLWGVQFYTAYDL